MLGLLPRGIQAVTGHDVSVTTSQLWKYLESSLSDDLKEKMLWNIITLEHSLCKFSGLGISDSHLNYDFGVYEESFCAVGTQGAFQLRHAKKYKLWEHTL